VKKSRNWESSRKKSRNLESRKQKSAKSKAALRKAEIWKAESRNQRSGIWLFLRIQYSGRLLLCAVATIQTVSDQTK
jgi:hypothetical protein